VTVYDEISAHQYSEPFDSPAPGICSDCGEDWPCLVRRLAERPSPLQLRPQRQSCKRCGSVDLMNFHVPDALWQAIAGPEFANRVLCLACFDQLADQKGIDYADQIKDVLFCGQRWALWFADRVALTAAEAEAQRLATERDRLRAALARSEERAERLAGVLKLIVRKFEELADDWERGRLVMPLDFLLRFNIGHVESWLPAMREALAESAEPDAGGERR
jgi:hypothetical protein